MLATPPTDETPTILQHVANNFTTNGQNFAISQHLDTSTCCAAVSNRNIGFEHVMGDMIGDAIEQYACFYFLTKTS